MDWKEIAEKISPLKNLADNEEIRHKLEGLSLYNASLKQLLDAPEGSPADPQQTNEQENELRDNTLAKIYELQKQTEHAKTEEEEAAKLIECFLYVDNYLSLYSEPELFFIESADGMQLCDAVELLNSKKKFEDIAQCMFFFQELNTKAHISIESLCRFLRESKTDVSEFINTVDYVIDKLDFLNRAVFEQKRPDEPLKKLYPFIFLINFTAQKLMLHRFASNYPSNVNKKLFKQALKQKEYVLDRIRGKIIKRAEILKQLKEKISEPMIQQVWFDERCVEVYDQELIVKREEPETEGQAALLLISSDKINRCCAAAYWTAFLMTKDKQLTPGITNFEADEWLKAYLAAAKEDNYDITLSLRLFLISKQAQTSNAFNNIKIKPQKKEKGPKGPSVFDKVPPLRLVFAISAAAAAVFIYFIISAAKNITL